MKRLGQGALITTVIAISIGATACTGGHRTPDKPPTTPSLGALSPDGSTGAQQQALEAYRGMWAAYAKAGLTANPDEPDLARYTTADALAVLVKGLTTYRDAGHILKGDLVTHPSIKDSGASSDSSSIDVVDCLDDTRFLVYVAATGALLNDTPGGRRSTTAVVVDTGGNTWKVTSFAVKGVGTC